MNIVKEQIKFFKNSAERDWHTALILFKNKHYDSCLFFCHLAIEKLFKAIIADKTQKLAPFIHDLYTLAKLTNLNLDKEREGTLKVITTFNIAGRYSDAKYDFYKKCTFIFTKNNLKKCKEIFLWLKKESQKK